MVGTTSYNGTGARHLWSQAAIITLEALLDIGTMDGISKSS